MNRTQAGRVIRAALAGDSFPEDLAALEDAPRPFKPFPFAGYRSLERRALVSRYRAWWAREVGTPYGLCGCGCTRPTTPQRISNSARGLVAGEPAPFYGEHAKLFHLRGTDVTDPDRRCACGCGTRTGLARRTERDESGEIEEYDGLRLKYAARTHRPPLALPNLKIRTPLEDPLELQSLADTLVRHGCVIAPRSGRTRSGTPRLKVESSDGERVKGFLRSSGRGRVGRSAPPGNPLAGNARLGREIHTWHSRCPLEAANVLTMLWAFMEPEGRAKFERFFGASGFPSPGDPSPPDPSVHSSRG